MGDYCTNTQVSGFLQRNAFSGSTSPTDTVVDEIIVRAEDYLNQRTGHSWKEVTITEEYVEPTSYHPRLGYRFDLQHRELVAFASGTDKIEVFNGNTYEDYVATKTAGNGPIGGDYFVDETNGVVYIRGYLNAYPKGFRFTYRYGGTVGVPKMIEDACIKLTAIDILTMSDNQQRFIDDGGTNRMEHFQRMDQWKEDIENTITAFIEPFVL